MYYPFVVAQKLPSAKEKAIAKLLDKQRFMSQRSIARRHGVSLGTVAKINRLRQIRSKQGVRVGDTRLPLKKFKAIVNGLVKHPEMSFRELARFLGKKGLEVDHTTIWVINKRLNIQSKQTVIERHARIEKEKALRRKGKSKKPRPCLFTPKEKWGILVSSQGWLGRVIAKEISLAGFPAQDNMDLLQQTMLEGFRALDYVRSPRNPVGYLTGVARNIARDYLRKKRGLAEVPLNEEIENKNAL